MFLIYIEFMEIFEHLIKTNGKLVKRKKTTEIILHCSATPEGKDYTIDQIDKWHKDRGFACIGYQFVIYRDGTIHAGRPENCVGAHCVNHNNKSIGICYIGGCANKSGLPAKDTRTEQQKQSLLWLVEHLLNKYNLKIDNVYCHNQFAAKACPSFKIKDFKKDYQQYIEDK